jgi:L-aminopeptidase/D-esterase-like protein
MITDVPGIRVGHWTEERAATGCTVVLFPDGTVASGEMRGGAPAEREMLLLDPSRLVNRLDAVVLTGGSAFGLAAADGVVQYCEDRNHGHVTVAGVVPIVVALGLFDLGVGDPSVRPGPAEGRAACDAARTGPIELGRVGAGTGARVGRVAQAAGAGAVRPGGLVSATERSGSVVVSSLVAVNAFGNVGPDDDVPGGLAIEPEIQPGSASHTTIGLVATNAALDKMGCFLLAQSAHDGLARAVFPSHTRFDGDAFVAAAVGGVEERVDASIDVVRMLGARAVTRAIRSLNAAA